MRQITVGLLLGLLTACSGAKSGTSTSATTAGTTAGAGTTGGGASSTGTTGQATTSASVTGTTGNHTTSSSTGGTTGASTCGFEGASCMLADFGSGLCCGGACTDPTGDGANCGGCGLACPSGQSCSVSGCQDLNCDGEAPGTTCAGNVGSTDPAETCAFLGTSSQGLCLAVAASCSGQTTEALCTLASGPDVGSTGLCCGATCTDYQNDPDNCGQCGLVCSPDATCADGNCAFPCSAGGCAAGLDCVATGIFGGSTCVAPSCSGQADGFGCAFSADAGISGTCCSGACAETAGDPANCGLCGHACAAGEYCEQGSCQPAVDCSAEQFTGHTCGLPGVGDGFCCGGSCQALDVFSDPLNCGGCARACPVDAVCISQDCELPGGIQVVSCGEPGEICPTGYVCGTGGCLLASCDATQQFDPCNFAADPTDFGTCCGAACVDTLTDRNNCGQCGYACATGTFCSGGLCVPTESCSPATDGPVCPLSSGDDGACCRGACADILDDPANCGGCGIACPGGEACAAGSCLPPDGGGDCFNGGCPAGTLCYGSVCLPSQCPATEDNLACDYGSGPSGNCCSGACINLAADPENCGTCGNACPSGGCFEGQCFPVPTGACSLDCGPDGLVCVDGYCLPGTCDGPLGTCAFGGQSTGACCLIVLFSGPSAACADLLDDPANCGACGNLCPSGQTCSQGVCSGDVAPCLGGSQGRFCALDAGTNWECCAGTGCTDLTTDPNNCGSCGSVCPAGFGCYALPDLGGPTAGCLVTTCTAATEDFGCTLGGGLEGECCNSTCINPDTDPNNCGGCTIQCDAGQSCRQAVCG